MSTTRALAGGWPLVAAFSVAAMLALTGGTAKGAPTALDCTFTGDRYPALEPTARPGSLYAVFIRRQLTCDEVRAVARRGAKTRNPGALGMFQLPGGWMCTSLAPSPPKPGNGKVLAGQCFKAPGRLVNWLPICQPRTPCKSLQRGR